MSSPPGRPTVPDFEKPCSMPIFSFTLVLLQLLLSHRLLSILYSLLSSPLSPLIPLPLLLIIFFSFVSLLSSFASVSVTNELCFILQLNGRRHTERKETGVVTKLSRCVWYLCVCGYLHPTSVTLISVGSTIHLPTSLFSSSVLYFLNLCSAFSLHWIFKIFL